MRVISPVFLRRSRWKGVSRSFPFRYRITWFALGRAVRSWCTSTSKQLRVFSPPCTCRFPFRVIFSTYGSFHVFFCFVVVWFRSIPSTHVCCENDGCRFGLDTVPITSNLRFFPIDLVPACSFFFFFFFPILVSYAMCHVPLNALITNRLVGGGAALFFLVRLVVGSMIQLRPLVPPTSINPHPCTPPRHTHTHPTGPCDTHPHPPSFSLAHSPTPSPSLPIAHPVVLSHSFERSPSPSLRPSCTRSLAFLRPLFIAACPSLLCSLFQARQICLSLPRCLPLELSLCPSRKTRSASLPPSQKINQCLMVSLSLSSPSTSKVTWMNSSWNQPKGRCREKRGGK